MRTRALAVFVTVCVFQDSGDHATRRVKKLVEAGVVNALVSLSKQTDSESSKELLARYR